jgi:hypothetical protein
MWKTFIVKTGDKVIETFGEEEYEVTAVKLDDGYVELRNLESGYSCKAGCERIGQDLALFADYWAPVACVEKHSQEV